MHRIGAIVAASAALLCGSAAAEEVFVVSRAFLDAIRFVESTDGRYLGDQDGGRSHGPYQISQAYLTDANEWMHTDYTLRDVIDSDAIAVEVMCGYWTRYVNARGYELSYEVLARLHNGGPNGPESDATLPYWEKVKAKMEKLENANEDQAGRD